MTVLSHHQRAAGTRIVAALGLALVAVGSASCYTHRANPAGTPDFVSREILPIDENAARYANIYDAIEHLRPEYLKEQAQGPVSVTPVAYLNGVRLADPTMLRHVSVSYAVEVRWVRPNRTSPLYGASHQLGGGIFVKTK